MRGVDVQTYPCSFRRLPNGETKPMGKRIPARSLRMNKWRKSERSSDSVHIGLLRRNSESVWGMSVESEIVMPVLPGKLLAALGAQVPK